jgi:DNA-binding transcriptional MerR regulator
VRISELAEHVGVPTSTVRYYERVGLLGSPGRTGSGYRDYDEDDAARLLFVARARSMGLSCEQIADLLPVWDGSNCAAAQERVEQLIVDKQAEIRQRIRELRAFGAELDVVRETLRSTAPPSACRTDLSCCMPATERAPVAIELGRRA